MTAYDLSETKQKLVESYTALCKILNVGENLDCAQRGLIIHVVDSIEMSIETIDSILKGIQLIGKEESST